MKRQLPLLAALLTLFASLFLSSCVITDTSMLMAHPSSGYHVAGNPHYPTTVVRESYPRSYHSSPVRSFLHNPRSVMWDQGYCSTCRRNPCGCASSRRVHSSDSYSNHRVKSACSSCGRNPCGCHASRSHSSHKKSSSSSSRNSQYYRIAGGSTEGKAKPTGSHTLSWYKERGYDLSKLKLRNKEGDYYRGR